MIAGWGVILAGGVGSRFWPLSTRAHPKQLLPLVNDAPLLVNTLERLAPIVTVERTLLLTNTALVEPALEATRAHGVALCKSNVIAEPRPMGTLAALAWAARYVADRDGDDAVMVCMYADWAVAHPAEFQRVLTRAAEVAAERDSLVTVGIVPTRPDPGFGYIALGESLDDDLRRAERFVEKPDRARAAELVRDGYLWNSGLFAWRAGMLLAEVARLAPGIHRELEDAEGDLERFSERVDPVSLEVGVLQKSRHVVILPGNFGWDDVGTWAALGRVREPDCQGNTVSGRAHLLLADHNVVFAQENAIILYGVSDLVVVTCDGLTLVTTVERSADLKTLVEGLPSWACECRRRSIQSDRGAASMAREFLEAATPRLDTSDSETSGASGGA